MASENTASRRIAEIRDKQLSFFNSGATLGIDFRKGQLRKLLEAVQKWEKPLCEALWTDLHKSYEEAYLTEFSIIYGEIRNHLKNVGKWARPKRKRTPLKMFPSTSKVLSEPLGNSLIIAPWNYPVQLLLNPLIGAISAGCTAVLKPSPYVPNVSKALENMVSSTFDEAYIGIVTGDRSVNQALLSLRWDMIFFTGSPALGRIVMAAASKNLTPVVLELGGKSPCIIDKDADIHTAAKRAAWGKCLNAGQTCIAPDYLIVHKEIKDRFVEELKQQFTALLGEKPEECQHYVRIVNDKAFKRLESYLSDGKLVFGGERNEESRYFGPTVLDEVNPDSAVMQEEIFGPIFPVLTFGDIDEIVEMLKCKEKPLAFYYFGKQGIGKVLNNSSSGGVCINDTIMHIANEKMPFGGVGNSGMSSYHDKLSFDAFTHYRSVVTSSTSIDPPFRYMPYKYFNFVRKLL